MERGNVQRANRGGQNRGGSSWRTTLWATAAFVFLIPLAAMQFTNEIAWDRTDFIIFAAMLVGACSAFEIAASLTRHTTYLTVVGIGIAVVFILVWLDLAVGIVGSK